MQHVQAAMRRMDGAIPGDPRKASGTELELSPRVLQDLAGRVVAGHAGDTATWVAARTTEIHSVNVRSIPRVARYRSHVEELVEDHFSVVGIAFGQAVNALEIGHGENVSLLNQVANIRRVLRQRVHDDVREGFLLRVPISLAEFEGAVLRGDGHEVLPSGRSARVQD